MNQKTMVESVTVRVPQSSSSSSLPKINPKVRCNHRSDSCCARLMMQNHNNFKRSAVPNRFMFYRGGSWVDFQSQVRESLRSGFVEDKPIIEAMIGGSKYVFDFLRMVQIDFGSGNQRSIAWIDENGKPFFPKVFVDEDFMNGLENSGTPNIEIEIRVDGMSCKRKFEHLDLGVDGANNEVSSSIKNNKQGDENQVVASKRQRLTSMDLKTSKWPNAKLLSEADKAYSFMSFLFLSEVTKTYPRTIISAIHKFIYSGPLEKARREVFERHNENKKAARGVSKTGYAWCGASSAEAIAGILAHGFELPRKTSRFPSYGVGIHLSTIGFPQLSAMQSEVDNNGEKHILLCRVILGNIEKVDAGSRQCGPSSVEFDSGADDPKNPRWYVVWSTNMNSHILPECVISFKSSTHLPGQLWSCNRSKNSLANLMMKIKSHLPSPKLMEVVTLCGSLLAGKLAKDNFIKQLRDIAGDELLMTVIQEIRSSG
ncbi:putative inactive poly [ADP-ribose] polymerase SRO3 [Senna tora]|uniref:Putative inactive poly [ADP-ribose] polymerase SRO3 n=1 Tax=Senna tora TaxID=362788 RepID=A0A834TWR4_9FABA|nr:putative inactive poly [ADP-ribose] polymerase SRO3 [Senna tora]